LFKRNTRKHNQGYEDKGKETLEILRQKIRKAGPGIDSAPSENEYQKYFLGGKGGRSVRPTISPPSCAECHESLGG